MSGRSSRGLTAGDLYVRHLQSKAVDSVAACGVVDMFENILHEQVEFEECTRVYCELAEQEAICLACAYALRDRLWAQWLEQNTPTPDWRPTEVIAEDGYAL